MGGTRQDMERCEVSVDGIPLGIFDTFSGGEADSDDTKHRSGGMGDEESLGGPRTRANFTVSRLYRLERDHGQAKMLDAAVGRGEVVAVRTMLDRDKVPFGDPITFTGTLKTFNHPEHDANSSDPKMVSLEVTADGPIS
jgi:hypothetical protein